MLDGGARPVTIDQQVAEFGQHRPAGVFAFGEPFLYGLGIVLNDGIVVEQDTALCDDVREGSDVRVRSLAIKFSRLSPVLPGECTRFRQLSLAYIMSVVRNASR